MDRPAKRRRLLQSAQASPKEAERTGENARAIDAAWGDQAAIDEQFFRATIAKASTVTPPCTRKTSPLPFYQGKLNTPRLHPREIVPYQAVPGVVKPIVQPVQTAVASFVEVVLDRGGTSVGNVLVPAESTVFNLNGYGPVTIDRTPPPNATPSPEQQNSPPGPPPPATLPQQESQSSQPTPQPAPMPVPQPAPSASTSQGSPSEQSPRFQLSNGPVVSSYSFASESIQFNVYCDRERILL
ncbi:MAG: hypothetical protein Q9216_006094 [Gyalolechia sp. 2 TL-2023]